VIDLRRTRLTTPGGAALIRALASTWRYRRIAEDTAVLPGAIDKRPRIYAFWHSQMLPLLTLHRDLGVAVLISAHRDGELIARAAERFGFRTVRGSTSRGAAAALRGLERALADGYSVAVTPDGPRGPAEEFAPGVLIAAQRTGAPIVLTAAAPSRAWRLSTWDQFVIPKPFARIVVAYTGQIPVTAATPRAAVGAAADFQARLTALNTVARAE
jgi:lysophospholipid acyltransferase (LPLAT)-like uncharacterized protein